MKIRLNYHSKFDLKLLEKKIHMHEFGQILKSNLLRVKSEILTESLYKTSLIYISSALSIIFFMAFVELSDFERIFKVILGISILSGNVWLLKKFNL
jgi:hypothetical protein